MERLELLESLRDADLETLDAYRMLNQPEETSKLPIRGTLKRAHFIKLSMDLPKESKKVNLFFRTLFALPLPISIVNLFLRIAGKRSRHLTEENIDMKLICRLIRYAKGLRVDIESDDATICIRIF